MNIYLQTETDFEHNGLGFLTDVINANVTDNLNGDYSLFFEYKIDGQLSGYLQNENIVKCKVADGTKQIFIIKNVNKTFNSIKVTCKHIFYLLLDNFLEDTAPSNLSPQPFLQWILDKTNYANKFIAYSDISTSKSARYVRRNPVDCILGDTDNSMVNIFGGELKRDNFDIHFNKQIGNDKGVKLIVGKNITGIDITIDTNSIHTRIMPQGFDGLLLPEKYVDSPLINIYTNPKIYKVEFSEIKYDPEDETAYHNLEEAYEALRNAVIELFESGIDKPTINIKVDWIELSKTNEYKNYSNLEKVDLGDIVTADLLGLQYKTRVIKTIYNPLIERIETFELGVPKADIGNVATNLQKEFEKINPTSILESARESATKMITSAMGGYIYKTHDELFIMDTDDPSTATKVWRWNLNGLGYSANGINGPYETAMTSDGKIVADFISSGKINTNVIEGYDSLVTQVSNNTNKFNDYYEKDTVNILIQNAETGVTNTFSEAGGNNILRNTNFSAKEVLEEGQVYEYWYGNAERQSCNNSANGYSILLQNNSFYQEQKLANGSYTLSFYYKKLNPLANVFVKINDKQYELAEEKNYKLFQTGVRDDDDTYIVEPITITDNRIKVEFITDINNSCEIYDIMLNAGKVKLAYSQNQNETITDTVNIGKGITIQTSADDTKFVANNNKIGFKDSSGNFTTDFNSKGTNTNELNVRNEATVVGILRQKVGDQIWDCMI